jgi:hypothetical protein
MHSTVVEATHNAVTGAGQWMSTHGALVKQTTLVYSAQVTEQARKTTREATAKLQELVR